MLPLIMGLTQSVSVLVAFSSCRWPKGRQQLNLTINPSKMDQKPQKDDEKSRSRYTEKLPRPVSLLNIRPGYQVDFTIKGTLIVYISKKLFEKNFLFLQFRAS